MMNRVQPENVHSTIFTPREYQVELVDACLRQNTLTVLASRSTRTFLITMVTRELAHLTRNKEQGGHDKRTLITGWCGRGLVRAGEAIQQNTNLAVTTYTQLDQVHGWTSNRWAQAFREAQVVIMTVEVVEKGLVDGVLPLNTLNLLVITDAHRMASSPTVKHILEEVGKCRILGMTAPVLSQACAPPQLESFLNQIEDASCCRVDTASEIVTVLRYVNKPVEKIVMCRDPTADDRSSAENEVRRLVSEALDFLANHRYDLVEVYGQEYEEFCTGLPDPNAEPRQILLDFLDVLNNLGLWCADRAALYALVEVEKLKKKTAYDRHYLLLCMIFTVMARIRAVVEQTFDKYSEIDQILKFSTPKVLRLVEILRQVRPVNFVDPRKRRDKLEEAVREAGQTDGSEAVQLALEGTAERSETSEGKTAESEGKSDKLERKSESEEEIENLEEIEEKIEELEEKQDELEGIIGALGAKAEAFDLELAKLEAKRKAERRKNEEEVKKEGEKDGKKEREIKEGKETGKKKDEEDEKKEGEVKKGKEKGKNKDAKKGKREEEEKKKGKKGKKEEEKKKNKKGCDTNTETVDNCVNKCKISRDISEGTTKEAVSKSHSHSTLNHHDSIEGKVVNSSTLDSSKTNSIESPDSKMNSTGNESLNGKKNSNKRPNSKSDRNESQNECARHEKSTENNVCGKKDEKMNEKIVGNHETRNAKRSKNEKCNEKITENEKYDEKITENEKTQTKNLACCPKNEKPQTENLARCPNFKTANKVQNSPDITEDHICRFNISYCKNNSGNNSTKNTCGCEKLSCDDVDIDSLGDSSAKNTKKSMNKICNGFLSNEVNKVRISENKLNGYSNDELIESETESILTKLKETELISTESDLCDEEKTELTDSCNEKKTKSISTKLNETESISTDLKTESDSCECATLIKINSVQNKLKEPQLKCCSEAEIALSPTSTLPRKPGSTQADLDISDKERSGGMGGVSAVSAALSETSAPSSNNSTLDNDKMISTIDANTTLADNSDKTDGKEAGNSSLSDETPTIADTSDKKTDNSDKIADNSDKTDPGSNKNADDSNSDKNNIPDNSDKTSKGTTTDVTDPGTSKANENPAGPTGLSSDALAMASQLVQLLPSGGKGRKRRDDVKEKVKVHNPDDPDSVCGLVFVHHRNMAKIIYRLLKELSDIGGDFAWIFPQFTVEARENIKDDPRAAEAEHKKQEEVLRRFRHHECNVLVSTRVLEEGIDVPQCNMVLRFDPPADYRSYVHSSGRARGQHTYYFHLITKSQEPEFLRDMATYAAFKQVLVSRCSSVEAGTDCEVTEAEANAVFPPYVTPADAKVTMASAIALLNKYCAKLPSDTFTRLTAMWEMETKNVESTGNELENVVNKSEIVGNKSENTEIGSKSTDMGDVSEKQSKNTELVTKNASENKSESAPSNPIVPQTLYRCHIMLPINSPLKGTVVGEWQGKVALAKMSAALECCKRLHQMGELDNNLQPVGKESMKLDDHLCAPPPDDHVPEGMPRPGTTKRRQYYYKKVAKCLTGEQPSDILELYIYKLDMVLTCPIPDEQNTRGRKIYRPEKSSRSFGIVTTKPISQVSGFPVFTRSGEVIVKVEEVAGRERFTLDQLKALQYFHKFSFTHVLRLEKYPIKFDPMNARTAFYIVPLNKIYGSEGIDWDFVYKIQSEGDPRPMPPPEGSRQKFAFQHSLYEDAVVMPWYRNQDQPQYFYVAEICAHLNPQSDFPDAGFETFEKYYLTKYGLQICNLAQPLLDVDHTSGRLNLLTPRHVNRKGVALPTTSEETKRAKRENLQQKQILVPELCMIHPFPASLWRKAVCLPTILYRINALLLADQLRICVASEVGLGLQTLPSGFSWPALDFGWSLADVLKKNQENQEAEQESKQKAESPTPKKAKKESKDESRDESPPPKKKLTKNGIDMEIGTWSNDMAVDPPTPPPYDLEEALDDFEIDTFDPNVGLPDNLTLLECVTADDNEGELGADWGTGLTERRTKTKNTGGEVFRVGSPSNFEVDGWDMFGGSSSGYGSGYGGYGSYDAFSGYGDFQGLAADLEGCESDVSSDMDDDDKSQTDKLWDEEGTKRRASLAADEGSSDEEVDLEWPYEKESRTEKEEEFQKLIKEKELGILNSPCYLAEDEPLVITKPHLKSVSQEKEAPSVGVSTTQGCVLSTIGCDNKHSTSNSTRIVNRSETLSLGKLDQTYSIQTYPETTFSFDYQPDLLSHPGPPPSVILQALTMSNANDGVNLERLETIGDSFLKYAITTFLYCTYPQRHEGKLSYLRSKQVSNLNLYRLGKRKGLGECMVATKFEPHDNWLPPGYFVPRELEEALIDSGVPAGHWNMADLPGLHDLGSEEIRRLVQERSEQIKRSKTEQVTNELMATQNPHDLPIFIPYNLLTQHSIPDKSIADCVEALIGAYLTTCGPRGALLFMSWLGIKVLPCKIEERKCKIIEIEEGNDEEKNKIDGQKNKIDEQKNKIDEQKNKIDEQKNKIDEQNNEQQNNILEITYGHLEPPQSPLHHCPIQNTNDQLELLLSGYGVFEDKIGYKFRDRSYLLQAFTHASYYKNRLTDCYQRLEFLGDAVLDYLITRHLYEDKRQHSPGALTDLRSALVNNTIFASLAVKYDFHKYFRHFSPGLDRVVRDFVKMQEENGHKINEEYYFMEEDECEAAEDIEVPKALGDVFESVAGAIFLDSGGSLDAVWSVYYTMMCREIEQFSGVVPKSPIRELLEMEPETAKFGKPERLVDGKVRVSVEIFGKGSFSGVGRNYRIAKSTAAKRALRHLKKLQMMANQGM